MGYRTKLDYSDNRQISQREKTDTILSGATVFGLPFSGLTVGPDLATSGVTEIYGSVVSTFSGNSTTTNYNWYDSRMALAAGTLSAITPSTSAVTQETDYVFTGNSSITVDGNTSYLDYSGTFFSVIANYVVDLGGGNYSGTVQHDELIFLSANSLDYSGRTIWIDNPEITRTDRLIISRDAQPDYIWTSINSEGMGEWRPISGITSGDTLSQVLSNGNTSGANNILFTNEGYGIEFVSSTINIKNSASGLGINYDDNFINLDTSNINVGGDIHSFPGITYDLDYSDNYTNRSLIDKGYLNAQLSLITGDTLSQVLTNGNTTGGNWIEVDTWNTGLMSTPDPSGVDKNITFTSDGIELNAIGNFSGNDSNITLTDGTISIDTYGLDIIVRNGNPFYIYPTTGFQGIQYASDIRSNFTDYSLVDKGYVDGQITGSTLKWYAEPLTAPTTLPVVSGTSSIAIGDNAKALGDYQFVVGSNAGQNAKSANYTIFVGAYAGQNATGSTYANYIGTNAGQNSTGVTASNYIGYLSGQNAVGVTWSNFMGHRSGINSSNLTYANYIGNQAGAEGWNNGQVTFIGISAGYGVSGTTYCDYIGSSAGYYGSNNSFSNFIGTNAGYQATGVSRTNFIGYTAGYNSDDVVQSNFMGWQAGLAAYGASYSNFIGALAGDDAYSSNNSNFIGYTAGNNANNANYCNFIGNQAGNNASGTSYSNFIGTNAGYSASGNSKTNYIGYYAGYNADDNNSVNFIGNQAGYNATATTYSNFIGINAGYNSNNNLNSNFIGNSAGHSATGSSQSNFIGTSAGSGTSGITFSNFIGDSAGYNTDVVTFSNFIGSGAGNNASNTTNSNFMGTQAGNNSTGTTYSNFMGYYTGYYAHDVSNSNFIGFNVGYYSSNNVNVNFIGRNTGYYATGVTSSNFIGFNSGRYAYGTNASNFIGYFAGDNASGNTHTNFIGSSAGVNAYNNTQSNFIGTSAGTDVNNLINSNFIGSAAGAGGDNSSHSNFMGYYAGYNASGSTFSNFIGSSAGYSATGSSYSILIGTQAGLGNSTVGYIGNNNIIIGTNISLPNAKQNSLNIGGVLFGTGLYSTVGGSPYTTGFTGGKIGILTADPTETLDVVGNGRFRTIGSSASAGALHYTADGTLTTNTSDERLKTNIQPLTNALNKVKQLRGVTYNWLENPSGDTRIGFIAQEVNNVVPELTFVNKNSEEQYMGVHYDNTVALLVEAVKELSTGSTLIETQRILAEDNNIELNYNGTHDSAVNGGIIVTKGVDDETNSEFVTNVNGDFISNVNLIPKGLVIPEYTPTSSSDTNGIVGNFTRDENYLYIKGNNGWKRVNLESF